MTIPSLSDYKRENYDNTLSIKITTSMLENIKNGAESRNINQSEFIRYLLHIGLEIALNH